MTEELVPLEESLTDGEVRRFLYREAQYLDEERYEKWRDLFAEDAIYWMIDRDQQDADPEDWVDMVSQVHRNGEGLDYFLERATSEHAWVYQRARVDRFYTNVLIEDDRRGFVYCKWMMQLVRTDRNTADWFGGKSHYRLDRGDGGELRIALKKVVNTNNLVPRGYQPLV